MPITVIVRSSTGAQTARLTFDGAQRVVIGRGAGSDIRLPDPSVSHRHASLRAQGAEFVVVDEASTNGTFVGDVRVAERTSRIVRSGSMIRVGRIWLEIRTEQAPITRDLAMATKDLALAIVAQAMQEIGDDRTTRLRVVEGRDQGATLPIPDESRDYLVGRGAHCDLALADADASREHLRVSRRETGIYVRDLGAKNGTWLGNVSLSGGGEAVLWRPSQMIQLGRSVLALEEPVNEALARIESAHDEAMSVEPAAAALEPGLTPPCPAPVAPGEGGPPPGAAAVTSSRARAEPVFIWSFADRLVMIAAAAIMMLSLIGLAWLLRG